MHTNSHTGSAPMWFTFITVTVLFCNLHSIGGISHAQLHTDPKFIKNFIVNHSSMGHTCSIPNMELCWTAAPELWSLM